MAKKELNDALSVYLNEKRKKHQRNNRQSLGSFFKTKYRDMNVSAEYPELEEGKVHVIEKEKPFLRRMLDNRKRRKENSKVGPDTPTVMPGDNADKDLQFEAEEEEMRQEIEESPSLPEKFRNLFSQMFQGRGNDMEYSDSYEYDAEKLGSELDEIDREEEELVHKEEELQKKRRSILSRIFSVFEREEEQMEEKIEHMEDDSVPREEFEAIRNELKDVSQFTLQLIRQLPKRKIEDLKDSESLSHFKDILRRRGLIKE